MGAVLRFKIENRKLAHALLAAVRSDLVEYLGDWPETRLYEGITALVDSILD